MIQVTATDAVSDIGWASAGAAVAIARISTLAYRSISSVLLTGRDSCTAGSRSSACRQRSRRSRQSTRSSAPPPRRSPRLRAPPRGGRRLRLPRSQQQFGTLVPVGRCAEAARPRSRNRFRKRQSKSSSVRVNSSFQSCRTAQSTHDPLHVVGADRPGGPSPVMPTRGGGFLPRRFASIAADRPRAFAGPPGPPPEPVPASSFGCHPPGGTTWPPSGSSSAPNQEVPFGYAGERSPCQSNPKT